MSAPPPARRSADGRFGVVGEAATQTNRMRLGAGGVMIRNHAPLVAAEQAVTLSLLHPGRVDVGLGRSGGSEPTTDLRIRRTVLQYDSFDDDVRELVHHCLPVVVGESDDEARWWFRCVQQRYLDRLRTGGAPLRRPDDVELDWSAGERYRVDGMLEAALVGSVDTVRAQLREVDRRLAPDEVMAMTDLPDPGMTLGSHTRLAGIVAAAAPAGAQP